MPPTEKALGAAAVPARDREVADVDRLSRIDREDRARSVGVQRGVAAAGERQAVRDFEVAPAGARDRERCPVDQARACEDGRERVRLGRAVDMTEVSAPAWPLRPARGLPRAPRPRKAESEPGCFQIRRMISPLVRWAQLGHGKRECLISPRSVTDAAGFVACPPPHRQCLHDPLHGYRGEQMRGPDELGELLTNREKHASSPGRTSTRGTRSRALGLQLGGCRGKPRRIRLDLLARDSRLVPPARYSCIPGR